MYGVTGNLDRMDYHIIILSRRPVDPVIAGGATFVVAFMTTTCDSGLLTLLVRV